MIPYIRNRTTVPHAGMTSGPPPMKATKRGYGEGDGTGDAAMLHQTPLGIYLGTVVTIGGLHMAHRRGW